jgi:lipid II:glycine glycyltransferase (peptidoglycan interpeptide bridge formation enzyme)
MIAARLVERRQEWNALVLTLPRVDFRQSWQWGAARVSQGWTVVRAAVVAGDRALAAAQVLVRRVPGLGRVLYAPRGPLLADDPEATAALRALVGRLRREIGGIFLRVSPGLAADATAAMAPLAATGFVRLPEVWSVWNTPRNVMRLDLTGSERDLLERMARKRRQHISTAGRRGITTAIADDPGTLRVFHRLHLEHGRRQNYPVPRWPALVALQREFAADGGLAIVTGHVRDELAGILVGIRFGPVAHTLYLATTPAAHRTAVGDLLHWELIRWARAGGCVLLDLGSSCTDVPPTPTHPHFGIYRFKSELGAELSLCAGYHDQVFSPWRYRLARLLEGQAHHVNRRLLGRLQTGVPEAAEPLAQVS